MRLNARKRNKKGLCTLFSLLGHFKHISIMLSSISDKYAIPILQTQYPFHRGIASECLTQVSGGEVQYSSEMPQDMVRSRFECSNPPRQHVAMAKTYQGEP